MGRTWDPRGFLVAFGILGPGGALWITQLAEEHVRNFHLAMSLLVFLKVYTCRYALK